MELSVLNIKGENTGRKAILSDSIFNIEPIDNLVYLGIKQYMATIRRGTHKSKERNEISGSTRKLRKQKGSGFARVGNIKNPLFVGGGRIFGPRPRKYGFKLNKKVKELARKSALTYKAKENNILILEDFDFEKPKTKNYIEVLQNLNISNNKSLLVLAEKKDNIFYSQRNVPCTKVVTIDQLSIYDILETQFLLFSESAVSLLDKFFPNDEHSHDDSNVKNNGEKIIKSKKTKEKKEESKKIKTKKEVQEVESESVN